MMKKSMGMMKKSNAKMAKVMKEFKGGSLRSGSKMGPKVTSRKQAMAIGMSEQRKANKGKMK